MSRLTFTRKKTTKKNFTPEQILEAKDLWAKVRLAGGSQSYVRKELQKLGVWVEREDFLKMSPSQKKSYLERLEKEEDDEQYTTEIIETELIFRESTTT